MGWKSPLEQARLEIGYSQSHVADRAGVTRQTYRAVEGNHRRPFLLTRYRIASAIRKLRLEGGLKSGSIEQVIEELWP